MIPVPWPFLGLSEGIDYFPQRNHFQKELNPQEESIPQKEPIPRVEPGGRHPRRKWTRAAKSPKSELGAFLPKSSFRETPPVRNTPSPGAERVLKGGEKFDPHFFDLLCESGNSKQLSIFLSKIFSHFLVD